MKAVIQDFLPDTPAEDTSIVLELIFNGINVRRLTATRTTPNRETYVARHSLFFATL
jgi:hypothetical protein